MAVDPALFESALPEWADRWPNRGERVRYVRQAHMGKPAQVGHAEVSSVWLGIEVTVDLASIPSICPALGDRYWIEPNWSNSSEVVKALSEMMAVDPNWCVEKGMLSGARATEILKMWFGR